MKWVVEKNMFSTRVFDLMVDYFKENNIEYYTPAIVPFAHTVIGEVPEAGAEAIAYGSIGLEKTAIKLGWKPGVWDADSCSETIVMDHIRDHYLNIDSDLTPLCNVPETVKLRGWAEFFIKPNTDNKDFAGCVTTLKDFNVEGMLMYAGDSIDGTLPVIVSESKELGTEWRIVIVDKKVVDYSIYRQYQTVMTERDISQEVIDFAEDMARLHAPSDVFCLDVAMTAQGLKVVEYTTFNRAGLYACDIPNVIKSINNFYLA